METRTILQIVLGVVGAAVILLGGVIAYELTRGPVTVVERTFEEVEQTEKEEKNKWEDRGESAIELVEQEPVGEMDDETREMLGDGDVTIGEVMENEEFVSEKLNIDGPERQGWKAEWWGETKYGAHFYLVTHAFEDKAVTIGPNWLVSLKEDKVVPKNIPAKVATEPATGVDSEYYDKSKEVVSAITKHTFDSGVTLAGALVLYFVRRAGNESDNTIFGWTIQHERNQLFKAYFQWREGDETTYAEFDFDYERKALKAVNLHAGNLMREGEKMEATDELSILPNSYDPDARRPSDRWTGRAAKAYRDPNNRPRFNALGAVLSKEDLIDSIEWVLRSKGMKADQFERCKKNRKCRWKPEKKDEELYRVTYLYNLGEGDQKIGWEVDLSADEPELDPVGRVSELAYRVVFPRN